MLSFRLSAEANGLGSGFRHFIKMNVSMNSNFTSFQSTTPFDGLAVQEILGSSGYQVRINMPERCGIKACGIFPLSTERLAEPNAPEI